MPGNAKNLQKSDSALMMSFAAGDCEGFEVLYRRHRSSIYRFFFFGTHGDKALAAELFHDVWMTVVRGRMRYTNDINFADWLFHSAWARLHDHLRLHSLEQNPDGSDATTKDSKVVNIASKSCSIEEFDTEDSDVVTDVALHASEVENETDSSLMDELRNLNPEQKEVVLLRYCFSMSVQDIADFIDVSKSTVDRVVRETATVLRQNISVQQTNSEQFNG